MSSVAPILITVPRYLTIPRIRPCPAPAAAAADGAATGKPTTVRHQAQSLASSAASSASMSGGEDDPVSEFLMVRSGKKRRLDHLSWEEKFQRK